MPVYRFMPVAAPEAGEILAFYGLLLSTPGCTWDASYPNMETVQFDLQHHALYCLRDDIGRLAAVASVGAFGELAGLAWPDALWNLWELARVGVHPALQGSGLGMQIVRACICTAKQQGCDGIRLLVACKNDAAQALYRKSGFIQCAKVHMYGHDFYAQQLVF